MKGRTYIIGAALLIAATLWSGTRDKRGKLHNISPSTMLHEGTPHKKTWLYFVGNKEIQKNLILIASSIAQYEPVSIVISNAKYQTLLTLLGDLNTHHYPIEVFKSELHSPWLRDEGLTFVLDEKKSILGIDFNHKFDTNTTQFILSKASVKSIQSNLSIKASCIEVDGNGTAIMLEDCIINNRLNPYWEKEEIEEELKLLLGLQKIIWIKSIEAEDDKPIDVRKYARFTQKGILLVHKNNNKKSKAYTITRDNIRILQEAKNARGDLLDMVIVNAAKDSDKSYLGYYLCNNALIMQSFDDEKTNYKAERILQLAFPNRSIEVLQIDALSSIGGSIHRVTQQEPMD